MPGRLRSDVAATRRITLRLTDAEHERLADQAASAGLAPVDFLRRLLATVAPVQEGSNAGPPREVWVVFGAAARRIDLSTSPPPDGAALRFAIGAFDVTAQLAELQAHGWADAVVRTPSGAITTVRVWTCRPSDLEVEEELARQRARKT